MVLPVEMVPKVGTVVVCSCKVAALLTFTVGAVNTLVALKVTAFVPSPITTKEPVPLTFQAPLMVAPELTRLNVCPSVVKSVG